MKILFLLHTLPFPADGGVWVRTYSLLRELTYAFDVTVLCFESNQSNGSVEGLKELRSLAPVEVFPHLAGQSRAARVQRHLRSVFSRTVYTRHIYESTAYRGRIRRLLSEQEFDLVHVDTLDLSAYLDDLGDLPVACTHHNVESVLLERRSREGGVLLSAAYLGLQARWMAKEERAWCPRVAINVLCSDADREVLQAKFPEARTAVVPNGVDVDNFGLFEGNASGSVVVGATADRCGRDTLAYFSHDILPLIRAELPDHPVTWVGSTTQEQQSRFGGLGIDLIDDVDDLRPFIANAGTFIVPLREGPGCRADVLKAWSMGRAVVSTSIGCEGLEAIDGENILIRDDPADFARAVIEVERDQKRRAQLGRGGRETAETVYSWTVIGRELVSLYRGVASGRAG